MNECVVSHLIEIVQQVVTAKYAENDLFGDDVMALDIPDLHRKAAKRIHQTRNPTVMLVHQNKFRCAALVHVLRYWGCQVSHAFNGTDAWTRHLKRNHNSFDCVLVDWDMPNVNGADLTHYLRAGGSTVCVIALLTPTVMAGAAIRAGANLFLRTPLMPHMRVLRELLLPPSYSAAGFPTHLVGTRSRHNDMVEVFQPVSSFSGGSMWQEDLDAFLHETLQSQETEGLDDESIARVVELVRKTTRSGVAASEGYVRKMESALRKTLESAHFAKNEAAKAKEEVRRSKGQLKECAMFHNYHPISDITETDLQKMTKVDMQERMMLLERHVQKQQFDYEKLENDYSEVMRFQVRLKTDLDGLPVVEGTDDADEIASRSFEATIKPLNRTISALRKSQLRGRDVSASQHGRSLGASLRGQKSGQSRAQATCERLERMLLENEDTQPVPADLRPVVFRLPWQSHVSGPFSESYKKVHTTMTEIVSACNTLSVKMLSTVPGCRPTVLNFSDAVHDVFEKVDIEALFRPSEPPRRSFDSTASTPLLPGATQSTVRQTRLSNAEWKLRQMKLRKRCANLLLLKNEVSSMFHFLWRWRMEVARRNHYLSVDGPVTMHQLDRFKFSDDMEKRRVNLKELRDVSRERDQLASELENAKNTIQELQSQVDLAEASIVALKPWGTAVTIQQSTDDPTAPPQTSSTADVIPEPQEDHAVQPQIVPQPLLNESPKATPTSPPLSAAKPPSSVTTIVPEAPNAFPMRVASNPSASSSGSRRHSTGRRKSHGTEEKSSLPPAAPKRRSSVVQATLIKQRSSKKKEAKATATSQQQRADDDTAVPVEEKTARTGDDGNEKKSTAAHHQPPSPSLTSEQQSSDMIADNSVFDDETLAAAAAAAEVEVEAPTTTRDDSSTRDGGTQTPTLQQLQQQRAADQMGKSKEEDDLQKEEVVPEKGDSEESHPPAASLDRAAATATTTTRTPTTPSSISSSPALPPAPLPLAPADAVLEASDPPTAAERTSSRGGGVYDRKPRTPLADGIGRRGNSATSRIPQVEDRRRFDDMIESPVSFSTEPVVSVLGTTTPPDEPLGEGVSTHPRVPAALAEEKGSTTTSAIGTEKATPRQGAVRATPPPPSPSPSATTTMTTTMPTVQPSPGELPTSTGPFDEEGRPSVSPPLRPRSSEQPPSSKSEVVPQSATAAVVSHREIPTVDSSTQYTPPSRDVEAVGLSSFSLPPSDKSAQTSPIENPRALQLMSPCEAGRRGRAYRTASTSSNINSRSPSLSADSLLTSPNIELDAGPETYPHDTTTAATAVSSIVSKPPVGEKPVPVRPEAPAAPQQTTAKPQRHVSLSSRAGDRTGSGRGSIQPASKVEKSTGRKHSTSSSLHRNVSSSAKNDVEPLGELVSASDGTTNAMEEKAAERKSLPPTDVVGEKAVPPPKKEGAAEHKKPTTAEKPRKATGEKKEAATVVEVKKEDTSTVPDSVTEAVVATLPPVSSTRHSKKGRHPATATSTTKTPVEAAVISRVSSHGEKERNAIEQQQPMMPSDESTAAGVGPSSRSSAHDTHSASSPSASPQPPPPQPSSASTPAAAAAAAVSSSAAAGVPASSSSPPPAVAVVARSQHQLPPREHRSSRTQKLRSDVPVIDGQQLNERRKSSPSSMNISSGRGGRSVGGQASHGHLRLGEAGTSPQQSPQGTPQPEQQNVVLPSITALRGVSPARVQKPVPHAPLPVAPERSATTTSTSSSHAFRSRTSAKRHASPGSAPHPPVTSQQVSEVVARVLSSPSTASLRSPQQQSLSPMPPPPPSTRSAVSSRQTPIFPGLINQTAPTQQQTLLTKRQRQHQRQQQQKQQFAGPTPSPAAAEAARHGSPQQQQREGDGLLFAKGLRGEGDTGATSSTTSRQGPLGSPTTTRDQTQQGSNAQQRHHQLPLLLSGAVVPFSSDSSPAAATARGPLALEGAAARRTGRPTAPTATTTTTSGDRRKEPFTARFHQQSLEVFAKRPPGERGGRGGGGGYRLVPAAAAQQQQQEGESTVEATSGIGSGRRFGRHGVGVEGGMTVDALRTALRTNAPLTLTSASLSLLRPSPPAIHNLYVRNRTAVSGLKPPNGVIAKKWISLSSPPTR